MLHLQAGVHLQEEEALVLAGHELHRPGAVVVHRLGQGHSLGPHRRPRRLVQERARRLLDDLLVAPLDRALPLEQVDHVAVLVPQHLDLHVPRALDELLDEDPVVAEAGLGLRAHRREAFLHVLAGPGHPDALAPAPGRGLDHHRIADLLGDLHRMRRVLDLAHMARHHRDIGLGRELLRFDLVAHGADRARVRPHEHQTLVGQALGEAGVLAQKAEARMHRLGARLTARRHDLVGHKIALRRRRPADEHRLVGHLHRQGIRIGLRIDNHRRNPQPAARLDDPNRDLPAVGDQKLVEKRLVFHILFRRLV